MRNFATSRRSGFLLYASLHILISNEAVAFAPLHTTVSSSRQRQRPSDFSIRPTLAYQSNLESILSEADSKKRKNPHTNRLSPEEEKDLLRQTVELRRLTNLGNEMRRKSDQVTSVAIANEAGYGNEIDLYEKAKYDGQKARETLVTRNMGLVHFCIGQILGNRKGSRTLNSLSREDLVQEGAIGLARAIDKWNPAIGGRFSTYAVYWIRSSIMRCIANSDDMMRVPEYVLRSISKVNKAADRLGFQEELAETLQDSKISRLSESNVAQRLAKEAGLTEKQLAEALKVRTRRYTGGYVPFDSWMQKGKDLYSDIPSTEYGSTTSSVEKDYLYETLSKFLRPREMEALSWRYGLLDENDYGSIAEPQENRKRDYLAEAEEYLFGSNERSGERKTHLTKKGRWGEAMSFNDVGKQMKVSAEYGRRLCNSALEKLRRAAAEGKLEHALLL